MFKNKINICKLDVYLFLYNRRTCASMGPPGGLAHLLDLLVELVSLVLLPDTRRE